MTRKDYRLIAAALKEAQEQAEDSGSALMVAGVTLATSLLADVLSDEGGYDLNGNRRFKTDVFLAAAGVST